MVSVNISITEEEHTQIEANKWISWSAIAREAARKKRIFEDYIKTKKVIEEDWKFCERIDWHPVDELPLREEYFEKLNNLRKKQKYSTYKSIEELKKAILEMDDV